MKRAVCLNDVCIAGKVVTSINYHHEYRGIIYYECYVSVKRRSGVSDVIPVIVSKNLYETSNIVQGSNVYIKGEYLSYRSGYDKKLFLYVHAKEIQVNAHEYFSNNILLEGYIADKGENRKTPFGKIVMDLKIAVYKENGRFAYIPCIIWGLNDREAERINIDDKLSIVGRIQSREYSKKYENGTQEKKVAYEISISKFFRE